MSLGLAIFLLAGSALLQSEAPGAAGFPLTVESARDVTGDGRAFLEVRTERTTYFVHEPIRVALRLGFEEGFLRDSVVPLFRPPMDLPVQLQAPWVTGLEGATALVAETAAPAGSPSFVLNDAIARGRAVDEPRIDGRRFRVLEHEVSLVAGIPGELVLPEARLRFAFATRFDDGIFSGFPDSRQAVDRHEAYVSSTAHRLTILPLPEAGRPADFGGAVGRLQLASSASTREVELGASVKLTLRIRGEGNLEDFDAPRLDQVPGWRVFGATDHKARGERTIEYDLAPQEEQVSRLPQVSFSYFDTTPPASYRTLKSEALPITVLARKSVAIEERAPTAIEPAPPSTEGSRDLPSSGIAWIVAGLAVLALGAIRAMRQRARAPRAAAEPARNATAELAALRAEIGRDGPELAPAWAAYLAARLGIAASQALDPGLAQHLEHAGVPADTAHRVQGLAEALVAARYGGAARPSRESNLDVLESLERAWHVVR